MTACRVCYTLSTGSRLGSFICSVPLAAWRTRACAAYRSKNSEVELRSTQILPDCSGLFQTIISSEVTVLPPCEHRPLASDYPTTCTRGCNFQRLDAYIVVSVHRFRFFDSDLCAEWRRQIAQCLRLRKGRRKRPAWPLSNSNAMLTLTWQQSALQMLRHIEKQILLHL